jgi:hypothetical protein
MGSFEPPEHYIFLENIPTTEFIQVDIKFFESDERNPCKFTA